MNTRAFIVLVLFSLLVIPLPVPGSMAEGLSAGDSGTDLRAFNPNPRITTVPTTSSLSRGVITTVTPATGTLILDSVPSGASVYIDGSYRGMTPFALRTLSSGNYQVVLKLNGYQDYSRTVTIPAGGLLDEKWTLVAITTTAARREPATTTPVTTIPERYSSGLYDLSATMVPERSGSSHSQGNASILSGNVSGYDAVLSGKNSTTEGSAVRVRKGVSSVEALVALQMAVGKIPFGASYDMNHDGVVNSADAREILRLSVQGSQGG
ncbi:MAG: PEGA domain-containing protein [Methanoregula sp.]|jgi:hypothetical protein